MHPENVKYYIVELLLTILARYNTPFSFLFFCSIRKDFLNFHDFQTYIYIFIFMIFATIFFEDIGTGSF